jgi:hypothetical protein
MADGAALAATLEEVPAIGPSSNAYYRQAAKAFTNLDAVFHGAAFGAGFHRPTIETACATTSAILDESSRSAAVSS